MTRMKLWRPFKEWSPITKAGILMIPASVSVLLHQWFMEVPPDTREVLARYYQSELQSWRQVFNFVVVIPFKEEAIYRWPALLLLFVLLRWASQNPTKMRLSTAYSISVCALLAMTYHWASGHDYPITVFLYGVVWGWLIFYTKNPFYSWLFHSACNAAAIILIISGHHLIY